MIRQALFVLSTSVILFACTKPDAKQPIPQKPQTDPRPLPATFEKQMEAIGIAFDTTYTYGKDGNSTCGRFVLRSDSVMTEISEIKEANGSVFQDTLIYKVHVAHMKYEDSLLQVYFDSPDSDAIHPTLALMKLQTINTCCCNHPFRRVQ